MSWPPFDRPRSHLGPPRRAVDGEPASPAAHQPHHAWAPVWWERILLAVLSVAAGAFMAWVSLVWLFILGLAADVACGGEAVGVAVWGVPGALVVGLGWTLALSLLMTAVLRRGVTGSGWFVAPALLLACVTYAAIDTARTPPPAAPIDPGACTIYD